MNAKKYYIYPKRLFYCYRLQTSELFSSGPMMDVCRTERPEGLTVVRDRKLESSFFAVRTLQLQHLSAAMGN